MAYTEHERVHAAACWFRNRRLSPQAKREAEFRAFMAIFHPEVSEERVIEMLDEADHAA